jgi:phosphoenolpyruvate carboxykinase (ATP)
LLSKITSYLSVFCSGGKQMLTLNDVLLDDKVNLLGLHTPVDRQFYQLSVPQLIERALANAEGKLSESGAFVVETGQYTGRSPNDRFIVDGQGAVHHNVDWGEVNHPCSQTTFAKVYRKMQAYLKDKPLYVFDGYAGADPEHRMSVRFVNELASQNLFVHQMFLRPAVDDLEAFHPAFSVLAAPGLKLNPSEDGVHSEAAVMLDIEKRLILIAGTSYSGEIKKSVFSIMNYLMPEERVLPMHCSANMGADGKSALFFGLSGTGKTTLSADPNRRLIGDDEHGWSDNGIFNFEGGCYAKAIRLSPVEEPEIYQALRFGALLENVVFKPDALKHPSRTVDYDSAELTENTRAAYPVHYISNAELSGQGSQPSAVIFLTADAFGVLPPIAKLTPEQAQYHFMSGYTSKLAGTERGITDPKAVFSACFGAPFMPRPANVYAALLKERLLQHKVNVYLINTGWQGGGFGVGKRVRIPHTRAMVTAALSGTLEQGEFVVDPVFRFLVPKCVEGVPAELLSPREQWPDKAAYDKAAHHLAALFIENFKQFEEAAHLAETGGPAF